MNIEDLQYIFKAQINEGTPILYFALVDNNRMIPKSCAVTELNQMLLLLDNFVFSQYEPGHIPRFVTMNSIP